MATTRDLLLDGFEHVRESARDAVDGVDERTLTARLTPDANSIAWLVWHLTRVQDDHISGVAGTEQRWTSDRFHERFGLPFDENAIGYGFSTEDVAQVKGVPAELLIDYLEAVTEATRTYVQGLSDDDLDRVVDESWDPPVTLAVRLVSVLNDDLQHAGQAAFVRGCV
ncbi:MAG: mycothiol transferase [Mycobacteriales bacterium]